MENKQTAVEWLETQFRKVNEYRETHAYIIDEYFQKEFEQAKQMEKEQIRKAYEAGIENYK